MALLSYLFSIPPKGVLKSKKTFIHKHWSVIAPRLKAHAAAGAVLLCAGLPMMAGCATNLKHETNSSYKGALRVRLLGINDFHGQIGRGRVVAGRPVGSAPVLAAYLRKAAAGREDNTLIIHAGDLAGASLPNSGLLQDEPSIMFLNTLGNKYCSANNRRQPKCNLLGVPGNHEFDEGKDEMLRLFHGGNHADGPFLQNPWRGAAFPHVCANIINKDNGTPLLPPFAIKKIKGVSIGIIGAITVQTPTIVTSGRAAGLAFQKEARAVNYYAGLLKGRGIRTIVAVIHEGGYQEPYPGPTDPAKTGVSGPIMDIVPLLDDEVDVVLSGHSHQFTNALVPNRNGHYILLVQAWSAGSACVHVDLVIDKHSRDVVSKTARVVTAWADAGPGLTPDQEAQKLVDAADARVNALVKRIIATCEGPVTMTQSPAGESALGNLIADAQRAATGADFAFLNPGGIRADMPDGDVTWGDLYTIQPFNNYLITMELTGRQVFDLLKQQWAGQPHPRILQVSGLAYTYDNSLPENDRITGIRADGATTIDSTEVYTVTVNSFMAGGGDNFSVLARGRNQLIGPIDLEALVEYLQALPSPFRAAVEGRITKLN